MSRLARQVYALPDGRRLRGPLELAGALLAFSAPVPALALVAADPGVLPFLGMISLLWAPVVWIVWRSGPSRKRYGTMPQIAAHFVAEAALKAACVACGLGLLTLPLGLMLWR